jgi:hypothetical protein
MRMGQPLDIFKPVLHPNGLIPMTTRSKTKLGQLNLWRSCFQLLLVYQFDLHGHWPSQESSIFCRYIIIIIIYIYTHIYIYGMSTWDQHGSLLFNPHIFTIYNFFPTFWPWMRLPALQQHQLAAAHKLPLCVRGTGCGRGR